MDVAIIGGGFTGAAIAWRFAAAGVRVALLEAARIGGGSTAASTALLMQEPDKDLAELARRFGRRRAARIWELSRHAVRDCVATIRRLRIACNLQARDSVYYALTAPEARRLRREMRARRSAGFSGAWLDAGALKRATGIEGAGGIRVRGNAQLDPRRACRGLIHAAVAHGAWVFERSPVTRIRAGRDAVTVSTPAGRVRARHVLIATGYATRRFRPLAGRFRLLDTYVAATRPLTPRERRQLGLGRLLLWDARRPYHYARWVRGRQLLLGGEDRAHRGGGRRESTRRAGVERLRRYFSRLYPVLDDVPFERAWDGLFAMTPDGLPYVGPHRRYPRHLFALGYGGNGMTFGFLAGQLLLDAYRGRTTADLNLFAFSR